MLSYVCSVLLCYFCLFIIFLFIFFFFFFFFSSRRRHTRCLSDWSLDVCSSDLPVGRFFLGSFCVGQSTLALHVRVTNVKSGLVVYEFDMYGGSQLQGRHGTVRASGLGRALHFDLQNAAERVYLTLSTNSYRYGARANVSLPE